MKQVNFTKKITPLMVRDEIIQCFLQAHSDVLEEMKEYHDFKSKKEFNEMKKLDTICLIQSIFKKIGADFDKPTKNDLLALIKELQKFALNFRKPEIIDEHYEEMLNLINKL